MASRDLRRITPYLRPHKTALGLMLFGAVGAQIVSAFIPLVTKSVIDNALAHHHSSALAKLCALTLLLGLTEGFLLFLRRFVLAKAASTMEMQMRDDLYAHLQSLSLRFHGDWQSGQLLSRAISDTNMIFREFVSFAAVYFVANMVTFLVVGAMLIALNPFLAFITFCAATPIGIVSSTFRRRYRAASRSVKDSEGDLTTFIEEAALGTRVITAFGREGHVGTMFGDHATNLRNAELEAVRLKARFAAWLGLIPNLTLAAVVACGALEVSRHALSLGGMVAFLSFLLILIWPVDSLGEILALTHEASSSAERIYEVFDATPEIVDRNSAVRIDNPKGRLVFDNVSFAYSTERTNVLDQLSLSIEPGETVALVGRTGSGKTTLLSLVPRLVDVTSGSVTIDNIDVRDIKLSSLRSHVGVAFEDASLFSASVRENLLFGHHGATDDDVAAALELAQATFVYDLPWGLDTRIGEQGLTLSGGQRQRLALARAVVGAPALLILDDPLSALDVQTEELVHAALANVVRSTTTLISAHRPSTVALATRVAFLNDGCIVATGTHSELAAAYPEYRAILSRTAEEVA